MDIIAKTFQGLEELLATELTELGANDIQIGRRMVSFSGDKEMLYRANFCLRTAVKILKPIMQFRATDADEVYEKVKAFDWSQLMDVTSTFLVDSVVFSEKLRHSKFVAYRVKDAIADYWREHTDGKRPNVSIANPDLRINIHISDQDVTISLDSSGESLHQRGYKTATVAAPLNEVLAAAIVMLSGWKGECDLIDPFCGSGTILIEAGLIARNIYPGVFRKGYAFEKWKDFDADLFDRIYNDDSQEREFEHHIYGYDINRQAVQISTDNARSAGLAKQITVTQRDFADFQQPEQKSIIITNPPYGERITTNDILGLYRTIGSNLKARFTGGDAWILSYHEECFREIGFRPSTKYALFNGALACELRKYQVFDGTMKDLKAEGGDVKTAEDLRRNSKYKPHRRAEGEQAWDSSKRTEDAEHYFNARPIVKPWERKRGERDENRGAEQREQREQRPRSRFDQFEAMDDEERAIIAKYRKRR